MFRISPAGDFESLTVFSGAARQASSGLVQGSDGSLYGTSSTSLAHYGGEVFKVFIHPNFFANQAPLPNGVYYLSFLNNGNIFGYYAFLSDPHYVYHFDLGYEYVFDAADGVSGVYLYDFKSGDFFYTSPTFPFPYLYDFSLNAVLYYYPDPTDPQRYNTNGVRYFYNFATGQVIAR